MKYILPVIENMIVLFCIVVWIHKERRPGTCHIIPGQQETKTAAAGTGIKEAQAQADIIHYIPVYREIAQDVSRLKEELNRPEFQVYSDTHKRKIEREYHRKNEKLYTVEKKIRKAQYILGDRQ